MSVTSPDDKTSYFFWTKSFFGQSGFAPAGTGNQLAQNSEEAIKGETEAKGPKGKLFSTNRVTKCWHFFLMMPVIMQS